MVFKSRIRRQGIARKIWQYPRQCNYQEYILLRSTLTGNARLKTPRFARAQMSAYFIDKDPELSLNICVERTAEP